MTGENEPGTDRESRKAAAGARKKYPDIASLALAASTPIAATTFQNRELGSWLNAFVSRESEARTKAHQAPPSRSSRNEPTISEFGPQIAQLERTKEIEENNYKYFQESLEKARIDEALDPSKMPNISAVQKPSPAMRAKSGARKRGRLLLPVAFSDSESPSSSLWNSSSIGPLSVQWNLRRY